MSEFVQGIASNADSSVIGTRDEVRGFNPMRMTNRRSEPKIGQRPSLLNYRDCDGTENTPPSRSRHRYICVDVCSDRQRKTSMATFEFHQIIVDRRGDVFCVRLKHPKMNEIQLHQLGEELNQLVTENGCRLMALALGHDQIDCLYSSFIGKMITACANCCLEKSGHIKLCEVGPASLERAENRASSPISSTFIPMSIPPCKPLAAG